MSNADIILNRGVLNYSRTGSDMYGPTHVSAGADSRAVLQQDRAVAGIGNQMLANLRIFGCEQSVSHLTVLPLLESVLQVVVERRLVVVDQMVRILQQAKVGWQRLQFADARLFEVGVQGRHVEVRWWCRRRGWEDHHSHCGTNPDHARLSLIT